MWIKGGLPRAAPAGLAAQCPTSRLRQCLGGAKNVRERRLPGSALCPYEARFCGKIRGKGTIKSLLRSPAAGSRLQKPPATRASTQTFFADRPIPPPQKKTLPLWRGGPPTPGGCTMLGEFFFDAGHFPGRLDQFCKELPWEIKILHQNRGKGKTVSVRKGLFWKHPLHCVKELFFND